MNKKKLFPYVTSFLFSIFSTFALQVQHTTSNIPSSSNSSLGISILLVLLILFMGFLFIFGFVWIIIKISKKLSVFTRENKGFWHEHFEFDNQQCEIGADPFMKRRRKRFLWLIFKRNPVYIKTKQGLEIAGLYNGECNKKEGFYLISIQNKIGMFKRINQIIIIPNEIKDSIIQRLRVGNEKFIEIECEGIDEYGNSDFYFIPLIKDLKNDKKFLDFTDHIYSKYYEKIIYRDMINENLMAYRKGVINSVETNPNVHFNRRKE
jgi:hypothetical protein